MKLKQNEEYIQTRDGLLSNKILDTTSLCIFWKDEDRRFVGVNQAFLDFYGFSSKDELIGKNDEDMGWHSDPEPFKNDEWRVLHEGISTSRVHGKCMVKGEERDILASKSPIYEAGKIVGLVGYFEDVTNDYHQKDEIRKLTETLNHIPGGICVAQIQFGRVIVKSVNAYLEQMIGSEASSYVGRDMAELAAFLHKDEVADWNAKAGELYNHDNLLNGVYRFKRPGRDSYQWIRMVGTKARLENDEEYLYFTFTNEDELKISENREKTLRQMYASSVDAANLVVWEYDLKTRAIHFAKSAYTVERCKELGLPYVIHNVPEYFFPGLDEENREKAKKLHEDLYLGKNYTATEIEYKFDNMKAPMHLHFAYTVAFDGNGRPIKAIGTSRNLSKEKEAEKQYEHELISISSSNEKDFVAKGHHDLTDNKVVGYFMADKYTLDVSQMTYDQAYHSLLNYVYGEEVKKKYLDMFDRGNLITRFHNGETFFQLEYRRKADPNSSMWVNMEVRTFQNPANGHIECFIYSYDITEKHIRQEMMNNLKRIGYEEIGLISVAEKQLSLYMLSETGDDWVKAYDADDFDRNSRIVAEKYVP